MSYVERLMKTLNEEMDYIAENGKLELLMTPGFVDKRLYAIYMTETYHYTKHNARNQAIVATRQEDMNPGYMRFCLNHAREEVGHELMALKDIQKLGFDVSEQTLPRPLVSTQALIAYLYYISHNENPVGRLGYSFWAERVYQFIRPLLGLMETGLKIPKSAMTFFNEHSDIDAKHAEEVDEAISRYVTNEEDYKIVEEIMLNSLKLTFEMTNEVIAEFQKVKDSKETRYYYL
ncbi:MAG: iron-containing redox enzyme family protein [Halobacteriovoraceae bacterium]|nr:iron-containing redox enzyme family protein [Halobacteriovoraceae bacterium]MCB9094098.1 iron-containing redox enzyme family protein [Halobacteriovoraceae bacterium]